MHAFSFIIGYRHKPDRILHLRKVIEWINGFKGIEVILVEQDSKPRIKDLDLKCKYYFTKSDLPYNRSWALNVGAKYATSDVLIFSDTDLILNPESIIESIKLIREGQFDMISPYKSVIDLTPEETNYPLQNMISIDRPGRGETDNQKINIAGGATVFSKEAFEKIGGYPESFIGWGCEDNCMTIKIEKYLRWKELYYKCYHLYHTREQLDMNLYQRNLSLLNQITAFSDAQLEAWINAERPKIGMLNKYDLK